MLRPRAARSYFPAYALAFAGTILKVHQWYHSRPLWVDEQMVLLNARDRAFSALAGALWFDQAAPLGWLAIQRLVITAFGASDRAMRAVPVLFGIATLWAGCWMARRWMTPFSAAVFIAICGIGQWMTFYALEAKPYSADAFWALFLPTLAIWAAGPAEQDHVSLRRAAIWWSTAAAGQWFSFGALFVTPACALLLCAAAWRTGGLRSGVIVAAQGIVWLVCFGAHYQLSIGLASTDEFLRNYWAMGFPPSGSLVEALNWFTRQAEPLSAHPGGAASWILFWVASAYGLSVLLLEKPVAGLVLLSVIASAPLLAFLHVVPLADRLALWTTPALYAAIAVAAGDVFKRFRHSGASRPADARLVLALPFSIAALLVSGEIVELGRQRVIIAGSNHGLDDARGIRMLLRQREPGDVFLTTHLGLPALWWYGEIGVAEGGNRMPDGAPVYEIAHVHRGIGTCRNETRVKALSEALAGQSRAMVYLGFGSNVPAGFQQMVLDDLSELGTRTFYSVVAEEGVAAIYDLREAPRGDADAASPAEGTSVAALHERPEGCVGVRTARLW